MMVVVMMVVEVMIITCDMVVVMSTQDVAIPLSQ